VESAGAVESEVSGLSEWGPECSLVGQPECRDDRTFSSWRSLQSGASGATAEWGRTRTGQKKGVKAVKGAVPGQHHLLHLFHF
jgi:hypothetical protein